MSEWEPIDDPSTSGVSLRWRKKGGGRECRIFHLEEHLVPEEIRGRSWLLVIRTIAEEGGRARYLTWSPHPTEDAAKDKARLWERNNA